MKIYKPDGLVRPDSVTTSRSAKSVKKDEFQRALAKASDAPASVGNLRAAAGLSEPRPVRMLTLTDQPQELPQHLETVLDRLETYSNALGDPQQSLKDIEPALLDLVSDAEALHAKYLQDSTPSPELAEILEELLFTAQTEYHKFQRGDYIDR